MTFVFLSADAFDERALANALAIDDGRQGLANGKKSSVRRPHRGIQIKPDTYATLSVVDGNGKPIPLVSESSANPNQLGKGRVAHYADFIMQAVSEERTEKQQIVETFGDSFIFFFGERPRMVTFTGLLMNTEDFTWRTQFWHNYENYLRGTKLVQRNARAFLAWDRIVVEGYPLQASAQDSAENPYAVQFQMTMFVTNYNDFGAYGDVMFPPEPEQDFSALNAGLDNSRKYISTTVQVRAANFASRATTGSQGISGFVREGIREVNNITNLVGNFANKMETILSGRVVRKPIGIAGFYQQIGPGFTVGAGGIGENFTGAFDGVDVKLKLPSRSHFTEIKGSGRSRKSDNVDEYPQRTQTEAEYEAFLLGGSGYSAILKARILRESRKTSLNAAQVALTAAADKERAVVENLVDVVKFAKTGFAMINTVKSAINDPGAVAADALGVSGIDTFNIGTATPF